MGTILATDAATLYVMTQARINGKGNPFHPTNPHLHPKRKSGPNTMGDLAARAGLACACCAASEGEKLAKQAFQGLETMINVLNDLGPFPGMAPDPSSEVPPFTPPVVPSPIFPY